MNIVKLIFIIICIVSILFLLLTFKKDNFESQENNNIELIKKVDEIKNEILIELENNLSNHAEINLPLILNDNNNICSNYNNNKEICLPGVKNGEYYCQNSETKSSLSSPKEYCNNWLDEETQKLQIINLNDIFNNGLLINQDLLLKQLSELDPYLLLSNKLSEQIKQNKILLNTQKYLLDNNMQFVNNKEEIVKEINDKNDEYDNNITSDYYNYLEEKSKIDNYKKYYKWTLYIIYSLLAILIIVILLNLLFTKV